MLRPRIDIKSLAMLCRRVGTSLEAGVDIRRVFANEAEHGSPHQQRVIHAIRQLIDRGGGLAEAVDATGDYFPRLFREMVSVGESTGKVDAVLVRLAQHYEDQVRLRRVFLGGIAWPLVQLAMAIAVVGFVIWIMGLIGNVDILGLGLTGTSGVLVYAVFVGSVLGGIGAVLFGIVRGWFWTRPMQRLLLRVPVLGASLRTIALSRIAWTLSVTFDSEMHAYRAVELAIKSTGNARYTDHLPQLKQAIEAGDALCIALAKTGVFPRHFLETLRVGEESGRISEAMSKLADQLREQAAIAFRALAVFGGFAVWGLVALLIIFMIFRLAAFYIGVINDAAQGKF